VNDRLVEVSARLIMANRAYYGLQNHMKSRNISRNIKTLLYKTLIRPVLTYGAKTWVLSEQGEHRVNIFERLPVTHGFLSKRYYFIINLN